MADQNAITGTVIDNENVESTVDKANDSGEWGTGIQYLAARPATFEIQRSNNFAFYVDLTGISTPNGEYASAQAKSIVEVACSKAFVPHFTQGVIEVKRGNNTIKFAGAATFSNGSISVRDYIGTNVKDLLMAWQRKSYDVRTEKVGLASDYKKNGYLLEYTPDYQLVRSWELHGCWISSLSEGEYSHDSNDAKAVDVTIEYDWADVPAQYSPEG